MISKTNTTLIVATGAKLGGAATILLTLLQEIEKKTVGNFIVYGGIPYQPKYPGLQYRYFPTKKNMSILFCLLVVPVLARLRKCTKVISLANFAPPPFGMETVIYYHQTLVFNSKNVVFSTKVVIFFYSMMIRFALRKARYIVQSENVKKLFHGKFGDKYDVQVCWPGLLEIPENTEYSNIAGIPQGAVIYPVVIRSPHKNTDLFIDICRRNSGYSFIGPVYFVENLLNYSSIGILSQAEMLNLYGICKAMVFTSLEETIGLPIFEFALTGKPVFVFNRPYIREILEKMPEIPNIILFKKLEDIDFEKKVAPVPEHALAVIRNGDWDFLFE